MVTFKDLADDSSKPLDLAAEVDRLRLQVHLAESGYQGPVPAADQLPSSIAAAFTSREDFQIRATSQSYPNGDVYKGDMLGPLRHGRGEHVCSSGDCYVGEWRYDKRHGQGRLRLSRGVTYKGDWQEDLADGTGTCTYEDGATYTGDWKADKRHGWGLHLFKTGERFEGEWSDDKMHGTGVMTYPDGSTFEGQWVAGARIKGKLTAGDGSWEYTGDWQDDQQHGQGCLFQKGLLKYVGSFELGLRSGEGKCMYADGAVYSGQWKNDHRHARHGTGSLVNGRYKYEGCWASDVQEGVGALVTANGDRYVGEFHEGKRHGRGKCAYADGTVYEGSWEQDQRSGRGACAYACGDRYRGSWARDKRHGKGTCVFADGTRFKGEWQRDAWMQSAADLERCVAAGPGLTRATAGQDAAFVVQARDEAGNRRLDGGEVFEATLFSPAAVVGAEVEDLGDGSYSFTYRPRIAGVYELHVVIGDEHVAASPYPVRVHPGPPCRRQSRCEGKGLSAATPDVTSAFYVQLRDEYGNDCAGAEALAGLCPQAELEAGTGAVTQLRRSREPDTGRYEFSYRLDTPGRYRLHVADPDGAPLPGSPFSVLCAVPDVGERDGGALRAEPGLGPRVPDVLARWEGIARAAYAADGELAGWDSGDEEKRASPEDEYIKSHPDVPVVENLEDIWQVSKLQAERKKKEQRDKQARLQEMEASLGAAFGQAHPVPAKQVQAELEEIVRADREAMGAAKVAPANVETSQPCSKLSGLPPSKLALRAMAAGLDDLDED